MFEFEFFEKQLEFKKGPVFHFLLLTIYTVNLEALKSIFIICNQDIRVWQFLMIPCACTVISTIFSTCKLLFIIHIKMFKRRLS